MNLNSPLKIAIIVPFRDNTPNRIRTEQLKIFIKYINDFYKQYEKNISYKIFAINQNDDGNKFNRGKLLNIGFIIAEKLKYNLFIFHDVDLLPSIELLPYYAEPYKTVKWNKNKGNVIHIANVWNRYNKNPKYLGGITIFDKKTFESINGFPNNFWGWGGEDDELYNRMIEIKGNIIKVPQNKGTIIDLENMNFEQKNKVLKENNDKFMLKYEMLNQHKETWKSNGLSDLNYKVLLKTTHKSYPHCEFITVKLD